MSSLISLALYEKFSRDFGQNQTIKFINEFLSNITDDKIREEVEGLINLHSISGVNDFRPKKKLVILIHGIRTQAKWFQQLRQEIENDLEFKVATSKYNFFNVLQFLFPTSYYRKKAMENNRINIDEILHRNKDRDVSLIAHSFGTYIAAHLLKDYPRYEFERIIFCGSVVNEDFRWDQLRNFPVSGFVNEVGIKDMLPALAKSVSFTYGAAGRFGFNQDCVRNRYHDYGHSDYFNQDFFSSYWMPFLKKGEIKETPSDVSRADEGWFIQVASQIKLPLVLLIGLILVFNIF